MIGLKPLDHILNSLLLVLHGPICVHVYDIRPFVGFFFPLYTYTLFFFCFVTWPDLNEGREPNNFGLIMKLSLEQPLISEPWPLFVLNKWGMLYYSVCFQRCCSNTENKLSIKYKMKQSEILHYEVKNRMPVWFTSITWFQSNMWEGTDTNMSNHQSGISEALSALHSAACNSQYISLFHLECVWGFETLVSKLQSDFLFSHAISKTAGFSGAVFYIQDTPSCPVS